MAKQGITAEAPTPFTSSNEVGVTKATADKLGLKTISDLKGKSQDLTLYGSPECRTRLDCLLGLQQVYGLKFKKFVPVNIDQRHEVLKSGQADLSIVFTTDPQIKRNGEVLLQDDKGMFPPYNSTFLLKSSTAQSAGPDLTEDDRARQQEPDGRGHAGAQRARGPRQGHARGGRGRLPQAVQARQLGADPTTQPQRLTCGPRRG